MTWWHGTGLVVGFPILVSSMVVTDYLIQCWLFIIYQLSAQKCIWFSVVFRIDFVINHLNIFKDSMVGCCHNTVKPLSHSTAIPWRWHGDLKFLRGPWDRTKIVQNIANDLKFSITWRCHGMIIWNRAAFHYSLTILFSIVGTCMALEEL